MIRRQLSLTDLIAAVQKQINDNTDLKCLDIVPENTMPPIVYVEVVKVAPVDSKTFYLKEYEVYVHIIADGQRSSVPVYTLIQEVQEAMTAEVELPSYVHLITQTDAGVQALYTDQETREKHAVLDYVFRIAYGYKAKL